MCNSSKVIPLQERTKNQNAMSSNKNAVIRYMYLDQMLSVAIISTRARSSLRR